MFDYLKINIKIMFRIPLAIFFSLGYPIMMMIIMMISYGNVEIGDGYHLIDKYFLVTIGMGILPLALVSFPLWLSSSIENDSLKRLQYFRVKFSTILLSDVFSHIFLAVLGTGINIIVAFIFFNLKIPSLIYFISLFFHYFVAIIVYLLCGGALALIFKNTQLLMSLGLVLMFLLYMFCGAFISYNGLPEGIKKISEFIPMKYAMNDFFSIWNMSYLIDYKFFGISFIWIIVSLIGIFIAYKKNFER